jgi:hypothetical protein
MLKRTRVASLRLGVACLAGTLPLLLSAEPPAAGDAAPAAAPADPRWPMRLESGAERITIHPPRWESFSGETLTGRAAASIAAPGFDGPTFGAIRLEGLVVADRVARTVRVDDLRVVQARFPGIGGSPERATTEAIRRELDARPLILSLDGILAQVEASEKEQAAQAGMLHAPPRIVFRSHTAVKVQFDGAPLLGEVAGSPLMRVVNTPFLVVLDPATKSYYLKGAGRWFSAADALGPFQDAREVPDGVAALAETLGPRETPDPGDDARGAAVEIVTATEPTELIWTDGPPTLATLSGTDLLYVTNTASDLFLRIPTQDYFVLLSGRWYTAPQRDGPWAHVPPDRLPADFARIPPGSAKGDVLAHVAGTGEAREAVLDADVPQTAVVDRQAAERPPVTYDGDSRFVPVEGTSVRYAVNTAFSVLEVGGRYYCCYNGVWYEASGPLGTWEVCVLVPREIYDLPPSCPVYAVRYVYVYDVTPTVVYCGYLPGYLGCYPWDGVVVYGTGYYYPSWCGRVYYPRPCTFGYAARYHSHHRAWGFSIGFGGPCAWLGVRLGHGGWVAGTYGYHSGGGWWGYGGYRHVDTRVGVRTHADVVARSGGWGAGTDQSGGREPVASRPPGFTSYPTPRTDGRSSGIDVRGGTRGGGTPPGVATGRNTGPELGDVRPPRDPREGRGPVVRDPRAGRAGTRGDGTPSVVPPPRNRDRDDGSSGRTDGVTGVRNPDLDRRPVGGGGLGRNPGVPREPVSPPAHVMPPASDLPRGVGVERPPVVTPRPRPVVPQPRAVIPQPPTVVPRPSDRGAGSSGAWRGGSPSWGGGESVRSPGASEIRSPGSDSGARSGSFSSGSSRGSSSNSSDESHRGGSRR